MLGNFYVLYSEENTREAGIILMGIFHLSWRYVKKSRIYANIQLDVSDEDSENSNWAGIYDKAYGFHRRCRSEP
jgi:hypothetical protein